MDAVRVEGVSKRFGDVVAVADISLSASSGEVLALLGPSGCGKTTFLRLIAGFETPDAGTIQIAGRSVDGVPAERRRVGFVFQDYALFPHLTVEQNVGFGVGGARPRAQRAARTHDVLELVGLTATAHRYPHELSGGQQQRVALARALAPSPALVLMDEPFSDLDADLRVHVRGEVKRILKAAGATTILVTHDQEESFEVADRVAVMNEGRIEQVDRPEIVYHTPATLFVADFVGQADFLPGDVRAGTVTTELGAFPSGDTTDGPVQIMLRPEDVSLAPGGAARVAALRFQGALWMVTVELPSGRTVTAAVSSQSLFEAGQAVTASFSPDHIVLFRADRSVGVVHVHDPRPGHRVVPGLPAG